MGGVKDSRVSSSGSTESGSGSTENDSLEQDEEEEEEGEGEDNFEESEDRSRGHASNSMSSLGHPVATPSVSATPPGQGEGTSHLGVSYSGVSQSTRNVPSTDDAGDDVTSTSSSSPGAQRSGRGRSSLSQSSGASAGASGAGVIPMPPRHPNIQNRTRAPSIPLPQLPSSTPAPAAAVEFPSIRLRADSGILPGVTTLGEELELDDALSVRSATSSSTSSTSSSEEGGDGERQDEVGLLSPGASRTNLPGQAPSTTSRSRTGSSARSVRSQNSIHGLARSGCASNLSLGLQGGGVRERERTNSSMARLEEDVRELPGGGGQVSEVQMPDVALTRMGRVQRDGEGSPTAYPYAFSDPKAWEDRVPNPAATAAGYLSSSSHSHSRSGSANGGENWTFGPPMPFMRSSAAAVGPPGSQLKEELGSSSDDASGSDASGRVEITRDFGPVRTPVVVHPTTGGLVGLGMPGELVDAPMNVTPMSASVEEVFYSPRDGNTPPEGDVRASGEGEGERDGMWGRYRLGESPYAWQSRVAAEK
ncbi:hypothetical protein NP233_g6893 [Leucocoprinus birnbaumii]|uniref:Uncharacterized protein n=1 Tax=Leucocoprinus birnbaumii TaxID=56174 RepID=A0AAD5VQA5_9AGAR|nr:hypothetical protein NP233_g6893 [Leucocoprinus birnbaumii]